MIPAHVVSKGLPACLSVLACPTVALASPEADVWDLPAFRKITAVADRCKAQQSTDD